MDSKNGRSTPRERFIPTVINADICQLCGRCYNACRNGAIVMQGRHRWVDYRKCTGCLTCVNVCPYNAIKVTSVIEGETPKADIDVGKYGEKIVDLHHPINKESILKRVF